MSEEGSEERSDEEEGLAYLWSLVCCVMAYPLLVASLVAGSRT